MLKISHAGCLGLSPAILVQFTLEMYVAARNREKFTKTSYFGGSRSFKVIDVDISKKLVASACCVKQHVCACCNHFHVRKADNGRITLFKGCPFFSPSFVGTSFTQWHEILSQNTRDSKLSYGENQKCLSHLGSDRYQVVTDTKTELP